MKSKKAFTLIELVSVLVILAILALIVTPLVLNIIRKARTAADKRSIDAYGRSIELAIADYLLENGTFPTSIEELTIEYSGDRVVCETAQLNSDSSVYLAECTVNNRVVSNYTYGSEGTVIYKAYSIGDEVTYNNIDYYVIKDSDAAESTVTLLKAEPLTSQEIIPYLSSTEVANKVVTSELYAEMPYYSRDNCTSVGDISGCSTDYAISDIKQVVDIWGTYYTLEKDLEKDLTNYSVRLATLDEISNLGYEWKKTCSSCDYGWVKTENTPKWVYSEEYGYSTMSKYNDSDFKIWYVMADGSKYGGSQTINYIRTGDGNHNIRPVITIKKSAL